MKSVTIAGGGLAGLTLGILLRRDRIPVTLHEANDYPRHRVCGEFISGKGRAILENLGVLRGEVYQHVHCAEFFSENCQIARWQLPEPALAISRYHLDRLLAERFVAAGGNLLTNSRFPAGVNDEGLAWATGRAVKIEPGNWRYIGLKSHARVPAKLESLRIYFADDGYVGVSPLPGGLVNVCGLFRFKGAVQNLKTEWDKMLKGAVGTPLHSFMEKAEFQRHTFSSVAGLGFAREKDAKRMRIGDAQGMIAPLTGNGMSIAFESAIIASQSLAQYARGEVNWSESVIQANAACDQQFRKRLKAARLLQTVLLRRLGRLVLMPFFKAIPSSIAAAYRCTHQ